MARIDEIRNWHSNVSDNEVANYIARLEIENEAARRRHGDLMEALRAADPEGALAMVPPNDWPTRHVVLDRIVKYATEYALHGEDDVLADLREAVSLNESYWEEIATLRSDRRAATEKAREARRA